MRGMVWGVLAVFCIGGVVFGMTIFDTWDPQLRLAVGLLIGVFVAVGVIKVLSSSQSLAGGRSGELAKGLAAVVQTWVDSDPANASKDDRPKKKRRKKRKRKKRAPDDAELDARLDGELAAED